MLTIDSLELAEDFVSLQKSLGNDVRWSGWDIIFHRPDPRAIYSVSGARRNGVWGFENRSPLQDNGTWEVDARNVRRAQRTRS